MGSVALMAAKDLRRKLRAPVGLIVMLVFPLAFAGMLGLAFGTGGSSGSGLPRIRFLLVDNDDDFLSQTFVNAANSDDFNEQFEMVSIDDADEARRMMNDGEASAALIIPEGFTENLLESRPVTLTIIKNPAERILPQVVEELVQVAAVVLDKGVRVLGEPLKEISTTFDELDDAADFPANEILATLTVDMADKLRPLLHYTLPPLVLYDSSNERDVPLEAILAAPAGETLDDVKARAKAMAPADVAGADDDDGGGFNLFALLLPMVSLVSILFLGENGMRDILVEQKAGTLTRQFSSPAGVSQVLVAKCLFTFIQCGLAMLVLAVVALAIGWISWSISFSGAALQVGAIVFASTGLATLVYGFAKTDRAASTLHSVVVMAMSFLGGSFIPLDNLPGVLQSIAPYTINYWGVEGLLDLTTRGGGVAEVAGKAGVLATFGLVGLIIGGLQLSRRYAAGGAT